MLEMVADSPIGTWTAFGPYLLRIRAVLWRGKWLFVRIRRAYGKIGLKKRGQVYFAWESVRTLRKRCQGHFSKEKVSGTVSQSSGRGGKVSGTVLQSSGKGAEMINTI